MSSIQAVPILAMLSVRPPRTHSTEHSSSGFTTPIRGRFPTRGNLVHALRVRYSYHGPSREATIPVQSVHNLSNHLSLLTSGARYYEYVCEYVLVGKRQRCEESHCRIVCFVFICFARQAEIADWHELNPKQAQEQLMAQSNRARSAG